MRLLTFFLLTLLVSNISFGQTQMIINKNDGTDDSLFLSDIKNITFKTIDMPSLLEGLVAYYSFSGNSNDVSGNDNNGTSINVNFTADRLGNANEACSFSGTNSYISVPNHSSLNFSTGNFSILAIIKTSVIPTYSWSALITKHNTATWHDTEYFLVIEGNTGYATFGLSTNTGIFERALGTTNICDGQYHTLVGVRANGQLKLYVDGAIQATASASINPDNSNPLNIGRSSYDNGSGYFNGIMDEVRIYNRALSEEEIQALNP